MSKETIVLHVTYTAKPAARDTFIRALADAGVLSRVRQEPGCLQYELFRPVEDADCLLLVEQWDAQANLDSHMAGAHFKTMQTIEAAYVSDVAVKRFHC